MPLAGPTVNLPGRARERQTLPLLAARPCGARSGLREVGRSGGEDHGFGLDLGPPLEAVRPCAQLERVRPGGHRKNPAARGLPIPAWVPLRADQVMG